MLQNLARGLLAAIRAASAAFNPALVLALVPAFAVAQGPSSAPPPGAKPALKVAFVYVSPIGDAGWTFQHDQARLAMQQALGARVQTSVVEAVAEGADSERVMRDLAAQGHRLIVATSFGYLEPALRVAAEFPDVRFEHAGGYKSAPNLSTYNARFYEARYLAGMLAGATTRSHLAGYVAGFPVPEVVQGINAFALGMRAVNPKAQVRVVWLNTWFDPAREREAAQALINQGADMLANHSGSPAVPQTAQENFRSKGVRTVGYQSDMRRYAPDAQLAAVVPDWSGHYIRAARAVIDGSWAPRPFWGGMQDGTVQLVALDPALPADLRRRVEARGAEIAAGRAPVFAAPLRDNAGRVRLAAGALDDGAIATMNWFVDGVLGSLPGQ